MEMLMKEKEVWRVIKERAPVPVSEEWKKWDEKALTTIALNVDDDQIQHIRNSSTAKHAWKALEEFHQKDSPSNRVHILRTIMHQKLEEGGNVETHVSKMNELFQKLLALCDEIKPEFFMCATLLGSLPESYDGLIQALEARSEEDLTVSLVSSKLIADYRRRMERNHDEKEPIALKVGSLQIKDDVMCYFCKQSGHMKKDCPKYKEWSQKKRNEKANVVTSENRDQFLFVSAIVDGWIMDSGATCHIVGSKEDFVEFNANHREKIFVANGNQVQATGRGSVRVDFLNEFGDEKSIKIVDVLYVPNIKGNLISVKRLTEGGYVVNFDERHCRINKGNIQVAVADISNNLYKLRTSNKVCTARNSANNCIHQWHQWHQWSQGHRGRQIIVSREIR